MSCITGTVPNICIYFSHVLIKIFLGNFPRRKFLCKSDRMIRKIWVSSDNRSLGELSELCHIIMFYVYRMLRTSPQRNNVIKKFFTTLMHWYEFVAISDHKRKAINLLYK